MKPPQFASELNAETNGITYEWYGYFRAFLNSLIGEALFFAIPSIALATCLRLAGYTRISGVTTLFDRNGFFLAYYLAMLSPFLSALATRVSPYIPLPRFLKEIWIDSCSGTNSSKRVASFIGAFLGIAFPLIIICSDRANVFRFCLSLLAIALILVVTLPVVIAFMNDRIRAFKLLPYQHKAWILIGFAALISPIFFLEENTYTTLIYGIAAIELITIAVIAVIRLLRQTNL